jgi:hypothetical protein
VFQKDGTFVKEMLVGKETRRRTAGRSGTSPFSIDPAQRFMLLPDGTNALIGS